MIVEYFQTLDRELLEKGLLFFVSSFTVMLYYYIEHYISMPKPRIGLINYLIFNNTEGTYQALKRLIVLALGSAVIGQLEVMNVQQILTAGAGVGWLAFSKRENR